MKVVSVSKNLFNAIPLPGMGRSIEINHLSEQENNDIREAFAHKELYVEFLEEPGSHLQVIQLWANPHALQLTLFV